MIAKRTVQDFNGWSPLTAALILATAMFASLTAGAAEVRYVGVITDGPTAPTSLVVGDFGLAALEPFDSQIEVFTVNGIMTSQMDIQGDARGLALHGTDQFLFCDREGGAVYSVDVGRRLQSPFATGLVEPVDVVCDGGQCLILDAANRAVVFTTTDGSVVRTLYLEAPADKSAGWWSDIAWDPLRQVIYILDQTHSRILAYGDDGTYRGTFCSFGGHDGEISRGGQVVCDAEGWVYITDRYQGRVVVYDEKWDFVLTVDPQELGGDRLVTPTGFAVDNEGFLYVAATEGAAIYIFHLDKSSNAATELVAHAVSPGPDQSMPANKVRLEAGVRAPASFASEVMVDFRLFAMNDTMSTVAQVDDVPLIDGTVIGNIVIGSVTWRPDVELVPETSYGWQARAQAGGQTGAWSAPRSFLATMAALPFKLEQNAPNPFNPRTVISFSLADGARAEIGIYDLRGNLLWKKDLSDFGPGRHQVVWQGKDSSGVSLPTGVYFYKLTSGKSVATRKMVLMK